MTDTMTSQTINLSSGDALYIFQLLLMLRLLFCTLKMEAADTYETCQNASSNIQYGSNLHSNNRENIKYRTDPLQILSNNLHILNATTGLEHD
jgi:hypothetical protein